MSDLNQCTIIGNLGRDPEIRYFPSGDAVCNISIACSKSWKDKNTGEKKEQTTWVPIAFNGPLAEIVNKYCKKGSKIMVTGSFDVRQYKDKDGVDRHMTQIRANGMQLLGDANGQRSQAAAAPANKPAQNAGANKAAGSDMDDDIPF